MDLGDIVVGGVFGLVLAVTYDKNKEKLKVPMQKILGFVPKDIVSAVKPAVTMPEKEEYKPRI